jgi:hypothetical protein
MSLKRQNKPCPPPDRVLTAGTPLDESLTDDDLMKVVERVMEDLERHKDFMTVFEICDTMKIIKQAKEIFCLRNQIPY